MAELDAVLDAVLEAVEALAPRAGRAGADPAAALAALELDPQQAQRGLVAAPSGAQGTVYWLQGPMQAAPAADIRLIADLLGRAREAAAKAPDRQVLRLSFMPVVCDRSAPDAPALHGYRLATMVRRRLGLPTDRPVDLPALLRRLGVVVEPLPFTEAGPEAAAVIDARRGAAAIGVRVDKGGLRLNPRRVRVALAHELCHLLFDPPRGRGVGLSLDPSEESAARRAPTDAEEALEKRAGAFAAELLLPTAGLRAVEGELPDGAPTSELVARAAARFDTPLTITRLHIENQLDKRCEPSDLPNSAQLGRPQASLAQLLGPIRRGAPRRAPQMMGLPDALGAPLDGSPAEVAACDAAAARLAVLSGQRAQLTPIELGARVMGVFDDLAEGEHQAALAHTLACFNPAAWPDEVLIGVVTHTSWFDPRPATLEALWDGTERALLARGWDAERVRRLMTSATGGAR
jgi:hypothetical protein